MIEAELCAFTFLCPSFSFLLSGPLLDALSDRIPDTELVLILIVLAAYSIHHRRPVLLPSHTLRSCLSSPWPFHFLSTVTLLLVRALEYPGNVCLTVVRDIQVSSRSAMLSFAVYPSGISFSPNK